MKPKTVARNEMESGFKEKQRIVLTHIVPPQGKLEKGKLKDGIC